MLQQVIYLTGIINDDSLSKHLSSRKCWDILNTGTFALTALERNHCGSGSASFEIIRDLVLATYHDYPKMAQHQVPTQSAMSSNFYQSHY
jgi:hypothetical protein